MLEAPGLLLAFGAGVLSFLSPCCVPMYPSYLSYLTGTSVGALKDGGPEARRRVLTHAVFFVLGFSVIWVALGLGASALGQFFVTSRSGLQRGGGALVMLMGALMLSPWKPAFLLRDARVHLARKPAGLAGSFVVGLVFAAGWTPCVGPILTAVLAVASQSAYGALTLLAFSLGFAIPFLLLAYFIGSARWLARYSRVTETVGGALLLVMGFMLFNGSLARLSGWLQEVTGITGF